MFSTISSLLVAGAISLGASPAAYDNATGFHDYQFTVFSKSNAPMSVTASLAPDNNCRVGLGQAVSWAKIIGPSQFILNPNARRVVTVSVGQPPSGQSELVAAFVASAGVRGGVHTNAGVGTVMRFSEPGKTVTTPCPRPKPLKPAVAVRTVTASNAGLEFAVGGLTALVILLLLAFGYLRLRNRGTHR